MKKAYLLAILAGLIVVGCGGSDNVGGGGNGGGNGGGGGTTGGRAIPDSKLGTNTGMNIVYLSGQARRAVDSLVAEIQFSQVQNSTADFFPETPQGSGSPVRVQLDGYTINSTNFEDRLANTASKAYTQFPFAINKLERTTDTGAVTIFSGNFTVDPPININARLFPGRQTSLQLKLNDAIVNTEQQGNQEVMVFDREQFEDENYDPVDNRVNGFLSDHIAFDLRQMAAADRPRLANNAPAEKVFFSGDAIGMSSGSGTIGSFEVLPPTVDPSVRFAGILRLPGVIAGRPTPGTYTVTEPDPRVPQDPNPQLLTSLQGIWRDHTEVLDYTNSPNFATVAIPNHDDQFPTPSNADGFQVLAYSFTGSSVTAMYQGRIRFTNSSTGVIEMWSINQLADATPNNPAIGTISNFEVVNGKVVACDYTITVVPTGYNFPTTGGIRILR